jgi:hypothetical protein
MFCVYAFIFNKIVRMKYYWQQTAEYIRTFKHFFPVLETNLRIGNGAIFVSQLFRSSQRNERFLYTRPPKSENRATYRHESLKMYQLQAVVNCLLVETRMEHDTSIPMRLYNPSMVIPDVLGLEAWLVVRVASLIMEDSCGAWTDSRIHVKGGGRGQSWEPRLGTRSHTLYACATRMGV